MMKITNGFLNQKLLRLNFKATDSVFVRQSLPVYIQFLQEAKKTKDYTQADTVLEGIKRFQKKYGAAVYPSDKNYRFGDIVQ